MEQLPDYTLVPGEDAQMNSYSYDNPKSVPHQIFNGHLPPLYMFDIEIVLFVFVCMICLVPANIVIHYIIKRKW